MRLKLRILISALLGASLSLSSMTIGASGPIIHRSWLRQKVAAKVFEIRGKPDGAGGTGFMVKAPSGVSYIVTNAHVCKTAMEDSKQGVLVIGGAHPIRRQVLEVRTSDTDLCLIEGVPGIDGLSINRSLRVGDVIHTVGHPELGPTVMSSGEVIGTEDIEMPQSSSYSIAVKGAIATTILTFGGSSGSPAVDNLGRVMGVVFAASTSTRWGDLIPVSQLDRLLKPY